MRARRLAAALAAAALVVAGCSDTEPTGPVEDDPVDLSTTTSAPTRPTPSTPAPSAPVPAGSTAPFVDGGDPRRGDQWHVASLSLPDAWKVSTGSGITIAVVDSGVDLTHPDLVDHLVPGRDLVDDDDEPQDENGHGTHVAGIAAAVTGNGVGVAGVAPQARIMPVRVLDRSGAGSDDVIAAGIDWAVEHGAGVVNLSLGEAGLLGRLSKGGAINAAIRRAGAAGVVVVAASGNEQARERSYRIGVPVVVVNASDREGAPAEFSNSGDLRAVSAPGVGILSTAPSGPTEIWPEGTDGYATLDGTSMAAPVVAGVAALLLAHGVPSVQVIERLASTATNPTGDARLGAGIVSPPAALG